MTKLILSTSNIMVGGASAIRRPTAQKSNIELTSSLRANFTTAQQKTSTHAHTNGTTAKTNGIAHGSSEHISPFAWTTREDSTVWIPSVDFSYSGLAEERSSYEITVKLFFIPNKPASCRCAQTREAIKLVLKELNVPSIDLLIVSYPGIAFDAEDEDGEDVGRNGVEDDCGESAGQVEDVETMIETWACLEELHNEGVIGKLGLSEFGTERLSRFLKKASIRPSVNQINVRDCCVVPKPLIMYAKQEKVELLTHNDCTNILPAGTVVELLGQGKSGAGLLSNEKFSDLNRDVEPQWVIKYTAVVKNRGVIENKGYFAVTEVSNDLLAS